MFQEITVIGYVGREPNVNTTPTGKDVANFSIAANERYGENEKTTWFQVVAWNGLAEVVAAHVNKGKRLMVKGTVQVRTWQDDKGQPRADMEITANTIRFLD